MGKEEDKIAQIEAEIKKTQVNKRTDFHLCRLRARLCQLRDKIDSRPTSSGGPITFELPRSGNARIGLYGFSSVGKSSFLNSVTNANSEVGAYEFTTLTCVPGTLKYGGAELQLLDLPGVIEEASRGKGRGKQVLAALRSCDLILMFLDAGKGVFEKNKKSSKPINLSPSNNNISTGDNNTPEEDDVELLEITKASELPCMDIKTKLLRELHNCGIRINKSKPAIDINRKTKGFLLNSTPPLPKELEKNVREAVLRDLRVGNVHIKVSRSAACVAGRSKTEVFEDIIDSVQANKKYLNCIFVYNKIETISEDVALQLIHERDSVVISCSDEFNIEALKDIMWKKLGLVRIFLKGKNKGKFDKPMVIKEGKNLEYLCKKLHSSFLARFKYANVWGRSVKFQPQRVGINHILEDLDVVQLVF
eukprot:GAHX01000318.1.p1 GENE.GAHX01000318.1~~GAHX01000318.1.p1  ORF type:complete len:420 (-),score=79.71 GAHX01000318.1:168-1427(-)